MRFMLSSAALVLAACNRAPVSTHDDHMGHETASASGSIAPEMAVAQQAGGLPAGAADAAARLAKSPRHGELITIKTGSDSVRAWIVYPERSTKAPVVVVVHEIFGLQNWIRAVADQLAADGFIAIAPDLLTGKLPANLPDSVLQSQGPQMIRTLDSADVQRKLDAVAQYAMALPAAQKKYGIVGFCWGGGVSFWHAVHAPTLGASVVYYGVNPSPAQLAPVKAPVLGLFGGNDARVDQTIPPADSAMKAMGKTYEHEIFDGAGHGFLRAQDGANGANMEATRKAWPRTIAWFKKYLGG